jgi:hypothetical protein
MTDDEERAERIDLANHYRRMAKQYVIMARAIEIELGVPDPDDGDEAVIESPPPGLDRGIERTMSNPEFAK